MNYTSAQTDEVYTRGGFPGCALNQLNRMNYEKKRIEANFEKTFVETNGY